MKGLYYNGAGIALKDLPLPVAGAGEARIKVALAGVCRTDIEIAAGYMRFRGVLGHEFVGVVEAGEPAGWVGKRVVGEINLGCGRCAYCAAGLGRHCPERRVLGIAGKDGALAEYLTLPIANLHAVPEKMTNETAVFVEPTAACFEILEQVRLAGKTVAVLGDGKLGLIAARVLTTAAPARLVLVGKHPEKLALARASGIETVMVEDFRARVARPEEKFEAVVEATGRAEGFKLAQAAVRPRGVIVQKSTVAGSPEVDLARVVIDEVTVIGSRCGPFPPAICALAAGEVKVEDLIYRSYPLDQAVEALSAAARPGALKVLIKM